MDNPKYLCIEVFVMTGSLSAIGYGLAAIGGGVGVGLVAPSLGIIQQVARLFTG